MDSGSCGAPWSNSLCQLVAARTFWPIPERRCDGLERHPPCAKAAAPILPWVRPLEGDRHISATCPRSNLLLRFRGRSAPGLSGRCHSQLVLQFADSPSGDWGGQRLSIHHCPDGRCGVVLHNPTRWRCGRLVQQRTTA